MLPVINVGAFQDGRHFLSGNLRPSINAVSASFECSHIEMASFGRSVSFRRHRDYIQTSSLSIKLHSYEPVIFRLAFKGL